MNYRVLALAIIFMALGFLIRPKRSTTPIPPEIARRNIEECIKTAVKSSTIIGFAFGILASLLMFLFVVPERPHSTIFDFAFILGFAGFTALLGCLNGYLDRRRLEKYLLLKYKR